MKNDNHLLELLRYVLPVEIAEYFELTEVSEIEGALHLHLEESNTLPEEFKDKTLFSNGFYEESVIKDFPIRDRKVELHIRRRRWKDGVGKSYSRQWDLVAAGTRYSKEFAAFLKEGFGYTSDTSPIT